MKIQEYQQRNFFWLLYSVITFDAMTTSPKRKALLLTFMFGCSLYVQAQQHLLIAVQQRVDSVVIYDIDSEKRLGTLPVGGMPHEITFDPVSSKCFVTNFGVEDYDTKIGIPGRTITVIDPYQKKNLATIQTGFDVVGNMPHGIKVRPGEHHELFVNIERPDSMLIYDPEYYREKRRFALPPGTHNFIFSKDGKRLWLMAGLNGVYEINPQNGNIKSHKLFQTPIRGLTFFNNAILASGNNELYLIERKKLNIIRQYKNLGVGQILYSAVTLDEKYILCPAPYDSAVVIVDAQNGEVVRYIRTDKTPINIQVGDTFAFVSHAQDMHVTKIDLAKLEIVEKINIAGTNGLIIVPPIPFAKKVLH